MNSRAAFAVVALTAVLITGPATIAQMTMQPTARPIVTAENEPWYITGAPITTNGIVYYPVGPVTHFSANEMIRSGHFGGIPLYARPTAEPYSLVYVPIAGGLMHPYERRRDGDLAGTVGTSASSFPITRPVEQSGLEYAPGSGMVQAPAPPSQLGEAVDRIALAEIPPQVAAPPAIGTTGVQPLLPPGPLATARRPQGLNGVFIEYQNQRYFSDGPAVRFDEKFVRVGDYRGFPVYEQSGHEKTVYIAALAGTPGVVAPYRTR
jgi:hypothetical protein